MATLTIPEDVLDEIYRHARAEFPNECCGWLIGPRDADEISRARPATNAFNPETHPTANDRSAERAYEMAHEDIEEMDISLYGQEPPKVIYHSHPIGQAYFSETDQANARNQFDGGPLYPVLQLVVGIDGERVVESRLFEWSDDADEYVEIAALPGKEV